MLQWNLLHSEVERSADTNPIFVVFVLRSAHMTIESIVTSQEHLKTPVRS